MPDDTQGFSFSGDLGNFTLDESDSGDPPRRIVFTGLTPGDFNVIEAPVDGWTLKLITCEDRDAESSTDPPSFTASIDLDPGELVKCRFRNRRAIADLSLTKEVDDSTPDAGSQVTYTITLTNSGPDAAHGVRVVDFIPSEFTWASLQATPSAGSATVTTSTGEVQWNLSSLASGAGATLTITGTVCEGAGTALRGLGGGCPGPIANRTAGAGAGAIDNTAEVVLSDEFDPDSTPDNQNAMEDDQDTVSIFVGLGPG